MDAAVQMVPGDPALHRYGFLIHWQFLRGDLRLVCDPIHREIPAGFIRLQRWRHALVYARAGVCFPAVDG